MLTLRQLWRFSLTCFSERIFQMASNQSQHFDCLTFRKSTSEKIEQSTDAPNFHFPESQLFGAFKLIDGKCLCKKMNILNNFFATCTKHSQSLRHSIDVTKVKFHFQSSHHDPWKQLKFINDKWECKKNKCFNPFCHHWCQNLNSFVYFKWLLQSV